jgi:hypothetical protein
MSRSLKLAVVRVLSAACELVDEVAYRPAIVKLTLPLPRWWSCQLAHLSMRLDRRWQTGYWKSESSPPAPVGICDACKRRAAWFDVGGWADRDQEYGGDTPLEDDEHDYLAHHTVHLCGWCELEHGRAPQHAKDLAAMLDIARSRSISWRWR